MTNAQKHPCDMLIMPTDKRFDEAPRIFQGCPTLAVTPGGRIFLGWYSGGTQEPHIDNYNLLIYSDDKGKSWTKPYLVIPGSRELCIHALDVQLWCAPSGALHVYWVQNHVTPSTDGIRPDIPEHYPWCTCGGYDFADFEHSMWMSVCENPDAERPVFGEPRRVDKGFLRCKPTVLPDGRILAFNYEQLSDKYGYSISTDGGLTYSHAYGTEKLLTNFDEAMAYVMNDGTIRMLARTKLDYLAESRSTDGVESWSEATLTDIESPDTRFFIARTPSGRVLLVNNDHPKKRMRMAVYLSEDDGVTWKYKRIIDERNNLSYPDADFHDGRIYLTYDRERTGAAEILFLDFTEEDIMNPDYVFSPRVVSKPEKNNN